MTSTVYTIPLLALLFVNFFLLTQDIFCFDYRNQAWTCRVCAASLFKAGKITKKDESSKVYIWHRDAKGRVGNHEPINT